MQDFKSDEYSELDAELSSLIAAYQARPCNETFLAIVEKLSMVREGISVLLWRFWQEHEDLRQLVDEALVRVLSSEHAAQLRSDVLPSLYNGVLKQMQPHIRGELRWQQCKSEEKSLSEFKNEPSSYLDSILFDEELDDVDREIVCGKAVGESSATVGRVLGLKADNVRQRLTRIKQRLSSCLLAKRARKPEEEP